MSRKAVKKSKHISRKSDVKYGDGTLMLLINMVMKDGKKSIASDIVYKAIDEAVSRCHQSDNLKQYLRHAEIDLKDKVAYELAIIHYLIRQVQPELEVKSRRVGGANYQVPVVVNQQRGITLALRWIIAAARGRKGSSMSAGLANELVDISYSRGQSWQSKIQMKRMADANKVFANIRKVDQPEKTTAG